MKLTRRQYALGGGALGVLALVVALLVHCSSSSSSSQHEKFGGQFAPLPVSSGGGGGGSSLVFNVADYGALCDNATDDRVSIANAITAACAATGSMNRIVQFPTGTCMVSRSGTNPFSIDLPCGNITLRGVRGQSFLKHPTGLPASSIAILRINELSHVVIDGLGFDGNWGNAVTTVSHASTGATLGSVSTINVHDTTGFPASGTMYVINDAGVAQAITYTSKSATAFNSVSGGSGTIQEGNAVGYVNSNTGINQTPQVDPKNYLVMIRGSEDVTIENSLMRNAYGDCIWLGQGGNDFNLYTHNVKVANVDCNLTARNGITLGQVAMDVHIDNSHFTNIFAQAFDSEPVQGSTRDVTIDHTRLGTWWYPGDPSRKGNSPLSIVGGGGSHPAQSTSARNFRVRDSIIEGSAIIEDAVDVVLERNRIVEDWTGYASPPVWVIATADDITVANNYIFTRTLRDVGTASAGVLVTYNAGTSVDLQPAGVRVANNEIHVRNGATGISVVGPGGSSTRDSGTASAVDALSLTDGSKSWTAHQWIGFTVQMGGVRAVVSDNTDKILTLEPVTFTISSSAWQSYLGDPKPTPSTGAYQLFEDSGVVVVDGNTIEGQNTDGAGAGGYGIYTENATSGTYSWWNGSRIQISENVIRNVTTDAIHVKSFAGTAYSFLQITDNQTFDDQPSHTTTNALTFEGTPNYTTLVMRGNLAGSGVTTTVNGLSTGRWLMHDGIVQEWAGYGSPAGSVSAPPGSIYHRLDGGASATTYSKESGTGTSGWAAAASSTPQAPDWVSQLNLLGGDYDPIVLASSSITATAGQVFLFKVRVYSSSFSKVILQVTQAQAGATAAYVGVYKSDGTQNASMATATVDASTTFTGTGVKTVTLSNSVSVTTGDDVYIAILVTGSPSPALQLRCAGSSSAVNGALAAASGYRSGASGSGLSALPGSITLSGMTTSANMAWVGIQ